MPPDIAALTRAAGQSMDPSVGAPYAALFPPEAWQGVTVTRDIAYGDAPLQKLDLYLPDEPGTNRPVLLFIHGGGFTRGSKHGDFYPDNITLWAAKQGMVGVNIDYRLAPDAPWPAAAQDLGKAIAWAKANVARYGGNPDRIVLWGHSAGANHVADYLAHAEMQGAEAASVKGAILLSPFYAADSGENPQHAYYGSDSSLQSAATVIDGLWRSTVPLFLADAEFDPDGMQAFATLARDSLCQTPERCPEYVHLKDHNHFTEGMAVGTGDLSLTGPVLQWMAIHTGRERVSTSPGFGGFGDPFYNPWYSYRSVVYRDRNGTARVTYVPTSPWGYGYYDPFFGGRDVESYTVYTSGIDMKIDRAADGERLFEGKAQALSTSNRLQYLVPNLIEAMFTDFPGNSGETVRISVAPENMPVQRR